MTIAIPLLLLILGVIALWILVDSKVSWFIKISMVVLFCSFTVIFYKSISSFLGWAALEKDLPEEVKIHFVVIKEPSQRSKGRIYLLIEELRTKYENKLLNMFGYQSRKDEPRLYSVPYSRALHQELQKNVIPRVKNGQIVTGKLKKGNGKGDGSGKGGGKEGNGKGGKGQGQGDGNGKGGGGGSESQEQEYHFYNLSPSEIQSKNKE